MGERAVTWKEGHMSTTQEDRLTNLEQAIHGIAGTQRNGSVLPCSMLLSGSWA